MDELEIQVQKVTLYLYEVYQIFSKEAKGYQCQVQNSQMYNDIVTKIESNQLYQNYIKDQLQETYIVAAVLLVVLLISIRFLFGKRKVRNLLFVGPSGSGKTALFHQLKYGSTLNGFVPSLEENVGRVSLNDLNKYKKGKDEASIVDLPGAPKLWYKIENNLNNALGIVYVLDASQFIPSLNEITSQLWSLLTNQQVQSNRVPLLICCNKQDDEINVMSQDFIKKKIEKELDQYRQNLVNSKQLSETKSKSLNKIKNMQTFQFSQAPVKVYFAKSSARTGELQEIKKFIKKLVK